MESFDCVAGASTRLGSRDQFRTTGLGTVAIIDTATDKILRELRHLVATSVADANAGLMNQLAILGQRVADVERELNDLRDIADTKGKR